MSHCFQCVYLVKSPFNHLLKSFSLLIFLSIPCPWVFTFNKFPNLYLILTKKISLLTQCHSPFPFVVFLVVVNLLLVVQYPAPFFKEVFNFRTVAVVILQETPVVFILRKTPHSLLKTCEVPTLSHSSQDIIRCSPLPYPSDIILGYYFF